MVGCIPGDPWFGPVSGQSARPGGSLTAVGFRADTVRGSGPGEIDYRLARRSILSEYRKGRLARHELCDAHPELVRAAREVGDETRATCPVCEQAKVRLVSYVFGPRLPAFGRCVTSRRELAALARRKGDFSCYVVEVCPDCSWNHLARSFALTPGRAGRVSAT